MATVNINHLEIGKSMSNQPLDKGRVAVIVEKYPSNQTDQQTGQPIMRNRYANVGRATKWAAQQVGQQPNIDIELDTMPIGIQAPVKLFIFWDSEQQNQQPQHQSQFHQQQQQSQQFQP